MISPISLTQRTDGSRRLTAPWRVSRQRVRIKTIVSIIVSFPLSPFRRFRAASRATALYVAQTLPVCSRLEKHFKPLFSRLGFGPSPACTRWAAINGLRCSGRRPAHRMQEEGSGRKPSARQFDLRWRDALVHASIAPGSTGYRIYGFRAEKRESQMKDLKKCWEIHESLKRDALGFLKAERRERSKRGRPRKS